MPHLRNGNPLLGADVGRDDILPLGRIEPHHFVEAFSCVVSGARLELARIANSDTAPTFNNTIVALERTNLRLHNLVNVLDNLCRANTDAALQSIEKAIVPSFFKFQAEIFTNKALFRRVRDVYENRAATCESGEDLRVLVLTHRMFMRSGAMLNDADASRLVWIAERLASLGTTFSQNVLADENALVIPLADEDVDGLPSTLQADARAAAQKHGCSSPYAITMSNALVDGVLKFSPKRKLREQVYLARRRRGAAGMHSNEGIIAEMLELRREKARLLGYSTFANFALDNAMAHAPAAVEGFLRGVIAAASDQASRERTELQAEAARSGEDTELSPWDITHYIEKARREKYAFDEAELRPYLQLENIISAAFHVAHLLFGLSFSEIRDYDTYHPDVRVWEVRRDEKRIGIFLGDYFARPSKKSGAWTGIYRDHHGFGEGARPVIVNVLNVVGTTGGKTLLSWAEARAVFHELGHALHALLSEVKYPLLSWINVPPDFVEFPSQLFECWLDRPEILERFAVHVETGKPIPAPFLERLREWQNFGKGYLTLEYAASALLDLMLHLEQEPGAPRFNLSDDEAFSKRIGLPKEMRPRHKPTSFTHVFGGTGYYACAYYAYLWAEMLAADAFTVFRETANPFDPATAVRLHEHVYSAGAMREPGEAFVAFCGRMPDVAALLANRGLPLPRIE